MIRLSARAAVMGMMCLAFGTLAWKPVHVTQDPLVRMPGSQPGQVSLEGSGRCLNCHGGYNQAVEPGFNWAGSMMSQAARDFLYFACMTVAAQDSIWAIGRPNAADLCMRCHSPPGWLEGRSSPTNASSLSGDDYDGVTCDFCHSMMDAHYQDTFDGMREGDDWLAYWDETDASKTPSEAVAFDAYQADRSAAQSIMQFNGSPFYTGDTPGASTWHEATSGQYFVDIQAGKRASFSDAAARHQMAYSRFHKSRYFCGTCHDVSNPVLANLDASSVAPNDGMTTLPSEKEAAHSYFHIERTFSEFMLSAYGQQGGAFGLGPFAPERFETSDAADRVAKCQDCHMRDVVGAGCNKNGVPIRPGESIEHPNSGQPLHDLTGGNAWVPQVIASAVPGASNFDPINERLLGQGAAVLTLDLDAGVGLNPDALIAGAERALQQLSLAASVRDVVFDSGTGALSFTIQNQTGHKLLSGFPEGRRMFVNVRAFFAGKLVYEINPYDVNVATLKGLPVGYAPSSPPLASHERHDDNLVYEMHLTSDLTGEMETFHFALATGRYKDNRIPPQGFRIDEAARRLAEPVWQGRTAPEYFTAQEYAGGYDEVSLSIPVVADSVLVSLYYQTTTREFVEFLRSEINGTGNSLSSPTPSGEPVAYVVQSDPWFAQLKAWGDTVWQLWWHNRHLPGASPVLMAQASFGLEVTPCAARTPTLISAVAGRGQVSLTWSDEHAASPTTTGYEIFYDQGGKVQSVASVGLTTTYTGLDLSDGQTYCYEISTRSADCSSDHSNLMCATPSTHGEATVSAASIKVGTWFTSGKDKGARSTFLFFDRFPSGDEVVIRAQVIDAATGSPVAGATTTIEVTGPEAHVVVSARSDEMGWAEAIWQMESPHRKGIGPTTAGLYSASVVDLCATASTFDGVATSVDFWVD